MASYKKFEDLPCWRSAISMATRIFALTSRPAFKYRGDLVNQIRRSALSVSNNIAEGFERGSTADLLNFLYIARGSCGETRSMLRFAPQLDGMAEEKSACDDLAASCESVSRQLYGWIDALKNTKIEGDRHLDDAARSDYAQAEAMRRYREEFSPEETDKAIREGRYKEFVAAKFKAQIAAHAAAKNALSSETTPKCPQCSSPMAKRHDRNGKPFWGCVNYPSCRGSRPWRDAP